MQREWHDEDAVRTYKELRARGGMLFTFLIEPGVKWHNNEADMQIRQEVVFRKIIETLRSQDGS